METQRLYSTTLKEVDKNVTCSSMKKCYLINFMNWGNYVICR